MTFRQYCIDNFNRVKYLFQNSSLVGIKLREIMVKTTNTLFIIYQILPAFVFLPTKFDPINLQCKLNVFNCCESEYFPADISNFIVG